MSLGGTCGQEYECADEHGVIKKMILPVAYHSRTFNKHEINYPVREREALGIIDCMKKWEYLLVGAKFKVVVKTDHSSLKCLNNSHGGTLTNPRLVRWQEYLAGHNFVIEWVPGKDHLLADGVSRSLGVFGTKGLEPIPTSPTIPHIMAISSKYDPRLDHLDYSISKDFADIYKELGDKSIILPDYHTHPKLRYHERHGSKLYYKLSNGSVSLCIPEGVHVNSPVKGVNNKITLREALIYECHDSPYMAHRGINKTYLQMRKLFYWPKLHKDVARYVGSCAECNRAKSSTRGEMLRLHPNECPVGPFHSISMDFITGLPKVGDISQILVVVDRFTKKSLQYLYLRKLIQLRQPRPYILTYLEMRAGLLKLSQIEILNSFLHYGGIFSIP